MLNNKGLTRVNEIRDLGIIMDSKLSFIPHIDNMLNKAYKQMGFVLRVAKPFKKASTYRLLYNSYVRSRLEFACPVWHPFYANHIDRIERLQKKFVKSLDYRMGNNYTDYESSAQRYKLELLKHRRDYIDAIFLFKIINSKVDAPALLQNINIRVPRRRERTCCKKHLFKISKCKTCYVQNSFIRRSCKFYNDVLSDVDIFAASLSKYKKLVSTKINKMPNVTD